MLKLVFGIILSICGIGVFAFRLIDSKQSIHWGDKISIIKSILWIIIAVVLLAGGIMLIASHIMGW